jgi:hypothetical protein
MITKIKLSWYPPKYTTHAGPIGAIEDIALPAYPNAEEQEEGGQGGFKMKRFQDTRSHIMRIRMLRPKAIVLLFLRAADYTLTDTSRERFEEWRRTEPRPAPLTDLEFTIDLTSSDYTLDPHLFKIDAFKQDARSLIENDGGIPIRIFAENGIGTAVVKNTPDDMGSGRFACEWRTFRSLVLEPDGPNEQRFAYVQSEIAAGACITSADVPDEYRGEIISRGNDEDPIAYGRMLVTQASGVTCGALKAGRHGMFYYRSDAPLVPLRDIGDWPCAAKQYGLPYSRERIDMVLGTVNENASNAAVHRHPTWLPEQFDRFGNCQVRSTTRKSSADFKPTKLSQDVSLHRSKHAYDATDQSYPYRDDPVVTTDHLVLSVERDTEAAGSQSTTNEALSDTASTVSEEKERTITRCRRTSGQR